MLVLQTVQKHLWIFQKHRLIPGSFWSFWPMSEVEAEWDQVSRSHWHGWERLRAAQRNWDSDSFKNLELKLAWYLMITSIW